MAREVAEKCAVEGCENNMETEACPNARDLCLDHCGEDH